MPRLIPKVPIDRMPIAPERDVARALMAQLPQDAIVYHSYPWLRPERNDRTGNVTLREGETDFVIVLPTHGMLVLEVKGGAITYSPDERAWFRQLDNGSLRAITDPFEQVRRNTHFLKERVASKIPGNRDDKLPFAYGYAVVFPDCDYQGPAPPGAEPVIIFSARDLERLDSRVRAALTEWSQRKPPVGVDQSSLEAIQKGISPTFQLLPVLFRKVAEQDEKLFRLTEEQMRLLDVLSNHERAAIEGVAGSGKTLLAKAQAQRFADQGKRTLLVCFNRALADWLEDSNPESYADRIVVSNFHKLCADFCRRAGIHFAPPLKNAENFWKEQAPGLLMDALDKLPDRFDAVVVDEGQDFYPDWWLPLEMINAGSDRGPMYVFYDPAQNLFVKGEQSMPALGAPFTLKTNCRNTQRIAAACGDIIGREIPIHPEAPEGAKPTVVVAAGHQEQVEAARRYLDEWIRVGNLSARQVAILCPNAMEKSALWDANGLGTQRLTENLDVWRRGDAVLFSTVRAFKGLEADAVIMLGVPKPDSVPYFTQADFYVAASRAKHLLTVIATVEGIVKF